MSYKIQASFSAGELDPALHERTTLQKYASGLATARNVGIGKTGRIVSRGGRKHSVVTNSSGKKVLIHSMPHNGAYLEFSEGYCQARILSSGATAGSDTHTWVEADLENVTFVDIDEITIGIYCFGKNPMFFSYQGDGSSAFLSNPFSIPTAPTLVSLTANGAPAGYAVEYAITYMVQGQESAILTTASGTPLLPIAAGQSQRIIAKINTWSDVGLTEMKVYRRPAGAGAFGYIGSSTALSISGADRRMTFDDVGQAADYTNQPPALTGSLVHNGFSTPVSWNSATAIMYQQRLVASYGAKIEASRVGFAYNWTRDFPLSSESALSLKVQGSVSNSANRILRFIESDGLVVFATNGVWVSVGPLTPTNLNLQYRGEWVIDNSVPPVAIPGGVLFVDSKTNTVRSLTWSEEQATYFAEEVSIYSDHLFIDKRVKSWAFQDGAFPLLWVTFNDGTYASFTYEKSQEMRAWTRHDSGTDIEYVAGFVQQNLSTAVPYFSGIIFVTVQPDGTRNIELGIARYATGEEIEDNPEIDKSQIAARMDSMVSWESLVNDSLTGTNELEIAPVVPDDWGGELSVTCGTSGIFTAAYSPVGTKFKYFDPDDKSEYLLEVVRRESNNQIILEPVDTDFPGEVENFRLYKCKSTFTGLDHLEGEDVAVMVDGAVVASPNNDVDDYPTVTVVGGSITLPNDMVGAIVHVGRPITADVETLDIDTIEQHPTLIESMTLNKMYIKVHRSRGLFIGNKFPADDKVAGMQSLSQIDVDYEEEDPIIGNRPDQPISKRIECTIPGDWKSQGRVCIRQVDPVHFEILSIIPDIEELRRLDVREKA